LIKAGGLSAVPWDLVMFMIPGVIVGAQVAAKIQGRGFITQQQLEKAIGLLFFVIGLGFALLSLKPLFSTFIPDL
jgi:uncharacterized protein